MCEGAESWAERAGALAVEVEDLRDKCIELLGALRGLLDNPMGGYEQAEAFSRARSHAWSVAARCDGQVDD